MRPVRIFGCLFSLALCVVLMFLWGRSTAVADVLICNIGRQEGTFQSTRLWGALSRAGSLGFWTNRQRNGYLPKWNGSGWSWQTGARDNAVFTPLNHFGFAFGEV